MADIFVGRRKTAVARARLEAGTGEFELNGRSLEDYFPTAKLRHRATEPLSVVEQEETWDVKANLNGGGTTGQADALRLAIARALVAEDEEWRKPLKSEGMLTRDSRAVERKKAGLKKARKAPQFSKR